MISDRKTQGSNTADFWATVPLGLAWPCGPSRNCCQLHRSLTADADALRPQYPVMEANKIEPFFTNH